MDNDNMTAVIAAARKAVEPVKLYESATFADVLIPLGTGGEAVIKRLDLEATLPAPARKRGTVTVFDAASFNMVLHDNRDAGNIAIYIDRNPDKPAVVGVLNGNGTAGPGWGDFRAQIQFRQTPQWAKWRGIDGKMLSQVEFAEFIEDNLADIADPAGAAMLEIATYLEATKGADFKSGVRLSSGTVQLQNMESLEARVGAGKIDVPQTLTLALAPLQGSPVFAVPARFRYRIQDGKLLLGVKLQRIEDLMVKVLDDVVAKIERGANISVLEGVAPAALKA